MSKTIVVYRCYAADGRLLYIGCTEQWKTRSACHRDNTWWWWDTARVTFEEYTDREEAEAAESRAIWEEQPEHNIVGRFPESRDDWTPEHFETFIALLRRRPAPGKPPSQRKEYLARKLEREARLRFDRESALNQS